MSQNSEEEEISVCFSSVLFYLNMNMIVMSHCLATVKPHFTACQAQVSFQVWLYEYLAHGLILTEFHDQLTGSFIIKLKLLFVPLRDYAS
jgi:hypothetical protein